MFFRFSLNLGLGKLLLYRLRKVYVSSIVEPFILHFVFYINVLDEAILTKLCIYSRIYISLYIFNSQYDILICFTIVLSKSYILSVAPRLY